MSDPIDRAIKLFEHGRIEEAAHLLAVVGRSAVDANEEERRAEIDDVIGQMQAHLSGHAREATDIPFWFVRGRQNIPRRARSSPSRTARRTV
jgi:hypothetical protein